MAACGMKRERTWRVLWLAADVLWIAFIIGHSLRTADESTKESDYFLQLLRQIFPWLTSFIIRKMGHFTEFFILGALLFGTWRSWKKVFPAKKNAAIQAPVDPEGMHDVSRSQSRNQTRTEGMHDTLLTSWRLSDILIPAFAGLLVAICDECVQLGVEGRSGEVRDVLIDFGGVLLAVFVCRILTWLRGRKAKKMPRNGASS